jgi:hypothetical protein
MSLSFCLQNSPTTYVHARTQCISFFSPRRFLLTASWPPRGYFSVMILFSRNKLAPTTRQWNMLRSVLCMYLLVICDVLTNGSYIDR